MRTNIVLWLALILPVLFCSPRADAGDLVWIGGTGNWNAAGNWNPAQVPIAADNVWITNSGTYTVTIPAGTTAVNNSLTVGGLTGTQTLAIDRATLTINGSSAINANAQLTFLVSQSVLTGPGSLTVNGLLNWANGTISGTGAVTIESAGVLTIGSGGVTLARTLNNAGSATWSGGNFTLNAGNTVNNLAGGVFDITADGRLSGGGNTPINNSGLFRLTSGTTGTIVTAPLNNNGALQVLASSLSLDLGGTHTGIFSNASGATLNLGGGAHSLGAGSRVAGSGTLTVNGSASLVVGGTFDAGTTLSVNSGIATLGPSCNVTGTAIGITGNGGIILYDSTGTVAELNLSAGTLGGTSPITVTGPSILAGGTVTNALLFANGGLTLSGNTTLSGTKLINPATAIWSAGNITGANGATISNLVGAVFINTFDGNLATGSGAAPLFINEGTLAKTNGTAALGTTSIDFQFINTGTVEVRTNTLRYANNQQKAGLTLLDGGALSAQAQPLQFFGGSLMGTGLVTVANLQTVVNSSSLSPGLPLGELDITGNYQQTASGTLNIELGGYSAGTNFDLLTVAAGGSGGIATLGGMLSVSLADGFSPTNGAAFTFLTASSRVGSFSTFDYPSNDIGMQISYDPNSVTLKVTNLKPVVANPIADPAPVTYGSALSFQFLGNTFTDPDGDTLTYSASGMPAGITFTGSTRTFAGTPTEAGTFPVTVTAKDSGTPSLTVSNIFTIIVSPAPLTIAALPQSKIYGAADPVLTYTVNGLVLADTPGSVLTGSLTRAAGESVATGPYAITQGSLAANNNYILSFTGSTLSIAPAPLAVAADSKAKIYGTLDPPFTASFTGFVNVETPSVLGGVLSFGRAPGQSVGSYTITPGGLTSDNYAISFVPGTLTTTPAVLAVTAENKAKTYGSPDPSFTVVYSGLVNGDTEAVLGGALTFARATGENVGTYSITPGGLSSPNYTISFSPGTLTIAKAALTVTADDKTKTYGSLDPAFTVSYAGFVNGDNAGALGGTLTFARSAGEDAGSYAITPNGLISGNYAITFTAGALTVTPATLSIVAQPRTKPYGAADPPLTSIVTGLQFTDTEAAVLTGALTRADGETVAGSPYAITRGNLAANGNYIMSFTPSALTITPATLTITAQGVNKSYGAVDPALTFTASGLQFTDTVSSVLTGALARTPGETVAGSPYAIAQGTLVTTDNYTISFISNTLTIAPAPLSVTADSKRKLSGAADPIFTVTYAGFVNGESSTVLSGVLSFSRVPGEGVGTYTITPGGLISTNYALTFRTGVLTITAPAPVLLPLTITETGAVQVSWNSVSNATYRVLFTSDLKNWNDLPGDVTASGNIAAKTDTITVSSRFYKVQIVP